jgi:hypothetical protein
MDRLTPFGRRLVWLALTATILAVLGVKGLRDGWWATGAPLDLGNRPALLLFNNDRGCECVLVIYQRADAQIAAWPAAARHDVPLQRINLEQRPDLGEHYQIARAPTLLLLDGEGNEVWRQDEVLSDDHIFDLARFESEITALESPGSTP